MSKEETLDTESGCPCREDIIEEEECEDCQDLPRGYLKNRREEEKMRKELED